MNQNVEVDDYLASRNELKKIRLQERERFLNISARLTKVLSYFKDSSDVEVPLIYFNDLSSFEKGVWVDVDNEISLRLESSTPSCLKFTAKLKAGAKFALKKHDSIQRIVVNEGRLIDLYNKTSLKKGEETIILDHQPHEHASDIYTEYTVYYQSVEN